MTQKKISLSVCVPVYNSEQTLKELCGRLDQVLKPIADHYDLILIDDASKDRSWQVITELCKTNSRIKAIQLMRNFGQHNALMCGFRYAKGDYIVTIDDDLQILPEDIPKLIQKIQEGYDVVYGSYETKKHHWFRNIGSSLVQYIYKKAFGLKNNLTSFRIMRREIVEAAMAYELNFTFIDGLLAWYTQKIATIPVSHLPRQIGKSNYNINKLVNLSVNMLTNFSTVPLQAASILGIVFSLFGFLIGFYFFIKKIIFGTPVMGFTALVTLITFFSGVQLLSLGIIGEYIGRVHLNLNKKPQYMVRSTLG